MNIYTVGIAGSTAHTAFCAEALRMDERFEISWVLTPPPQPQGRKHIVTANPLENWALKHGIPCIPVQEKITSQLQESLPSKPDFLLVVDFGYLVPEWLLKTPQVAPINIHPSRLPRWRGSSPGQFVLLHGEKTSAVTIMIMDKGLDTGPLLWQGEVEVSHTWSLADYYNKSFELASASLPKILVDLATGELSSSPQPTESETAVARRLEKNDGYLPWTWLAPLMGKELESTLEIPTEVSQDLSPLLSEVQKTTGNAWPTVIKHAVQALTPWPGIWTIMPTAQGWKRMKILSVKVKEDEKNVQRLVLEQIQVEGKNISHWKKNQ